MVHVAWRRYYGLAVEKCLLNHRTPTEVRMYPDRGTHVLRPRYACTPTEVRMYPDRGTHTPRPKRDDFQKYLTLCALLNKQILL